MNNKRNDDKGLLGKKLPHLAKVVLQRTQSLEYVGWSHWWQLLQVRKRWLYIDLQKIELRHDWAMMAMTWISRWKENQAATNEQQTGHHGKSLTKSWQRHYLKVAKEFNSNFHHDDCHCNQSVHSGVSVTKACARLWRHIATHSFIGCKQSIFVNAIVIVVESWSLSWS